MKNQSERTGTAASIRVACARRLIPAVCLAGVVLGGLAAGDTQATGADAGDTMYVDFANGDDSADGRSPGTAWQHSPGDPNATGNPAEVSLGPGDRVVFKGGVVYQGAITVEESGEPDDPIILDANTESEFGEGRAILDGGQVIEDWEPVTSAAEVDGNPAWEEIVYADVDLDISSNVAHGDFVKHRGEPRDRQAPWQRVLLTDGDAGVLPIAQSPEPSDRFFPDRPGDFYESPHTLEVASPDTEDSILTDQHNLVSDDPDEYQGMFVGVHGGNNHVYFGRVKGYDPDAHELRLPKFEWETYDETRYAFFNSVRLIDEPGEWAIESLEDGRSRIYLLPANDGVDAPENIGFPVEETAVSLEGGASHVEVLGFLKQRYAGGDGGVNIGRGSRDVTVADCEIRFVSGRAGIRPNHAEDVTVENCYIHHNPGWTVGIFPNRIDGFTIRGNYLDRNTGTGIRKYESENGVVADNYILGHFGMHAGALSTYIGSENILFDSNYIQGSAQINRNARDLTYRNNVIDGMNRSSSLLRIWRSGSVRGEDVENLTFENNTFVRVNRDGWSTGIFGQEGASTSRGLDVRDNILYDVSGRLEGRFEDNIYLKEPDARFMGEGNRIVADLDDLFLDPRNGDFRRKPGGPMMNAGADVPPPEDRWDGGAEGAPDSL